MNLSTVRAVTAAALAFASLASLPGRASAQLPSGPAHRLLASRSELEQKLNELRQIEASTRASTQRSAEISYTQGRLEAGDFRAGDRIELRVEDPLPVSSAGTAAKSPEQQLTDTFTVNGTQELTLPLLGSVPLRGVLRSELQQYLTAQIATRIREPAVHARPLIGVAVTGGVLKPGYYAVPPDAGVGAVITAAGGGNKDAKITDVKIVHDGNTIWKGQALQRAIAAGSTLDDLRVQPGDEIVVGQRGSATDALRMAAVILSIPVAILSISRFSH
jgi:protein involved in polysaccharide export with SLBB domain